MTFWLNGEFRNDRAAIDIADRGFLLGDGVFETLLVRNGVGAFLDAHLARLADGLHALHIDAPPLAGVGDILRTLIVKNNIQSDASARITITRGPAGRGLVFPDASEARATVLITVQAAPDSKPEAQSPLRLKISSFTRAETGVSARCKTLNYLDNILARNEALAAGADDAVMLNSHGRVACASSANIFLIDQNGAVVTPSVDEGALQGVVRGLLLKAGAETGLDIREGSIEGPVLQEGQVFLTNSLMGLRSCIMDGAATSWPPEAMQILQRLQSWYEDSLRDEIARKA